jgi:ABC-type Fe3+-hydroxamate transport system substrate-binding protein
MEGRSAGLSTAHRVLGAFGDRDPFCVGGRRATHRRHRLLRLPASRDSQAQGRGDVSPNIEQIIGLRPDFVITAVGASQKETAFRLERLGVPVYVLNPQGVDDILASILGVGELVSREQEAQRVVVGLRDRLSAVEQRLLGQRPVRAFYLLWYHPLMTVGRGSFLHEIVTLAGGGNLAGDVLSAEVWQFERI